MSVQRNIPEHAMLSVLLSCEEIAARVNELALQLSRDYTGNDLL